MVYDRPYIIGISPTTMIIPTFAVIWNCWTICDSCFSPLTSNRVFKRLDFKGGDRWVTGEGGAIPQSEL
jgi:hypothetical protein